ncbi:amino acid adenylation domain-containing protein [Photobacterium sp. WH77]|uniref:non-ribosomal peptide synthetase n=1 Tax=unclassified Photobacterium TaxID=2628852 RepID=UPI001EDBADE0|nr:MULTISPECIES: amino acid adenylation domain-containing protein [unclassified Photobacterium]MCG2838055.1 amino acid adenylation domain-containing protein [Photobacterium sp. WH77]MCG2845673.1 amino acid adenylation domain-containing protein [Photobacterium sp. WH80]
MNVDQVGKLTLKKQVVNKQIVKNHGRLSFRQDGQASHEADREEEYLDALYRGQLPLHQPLAEQTTAVSEPQEQPLTDIQYAYLIGRNTGLELGGLSSSYYLELDVDALDEERFKYAVNQIIGRHAMLRAVAVSGGKQKIVPACSLYCIKSKDISAWEASEQDKYLTTLRQSLEKQRLTLDEAPSFEMRITRLTEKTWRLHCHFDLMFLDVISVRLVLKDIWREYQQKGDATPVKLPDFLNYVAAERILQGEAQGRNDQQYWLERINHLPPAPELPLNISPQQIEHPNIQRLSRLLPMQTLASLKQAADKHGLTAEALLLGCYTEVIRQWSKRQDFTLTLTQMGRRPYEDAIDQTVGNFLQPQLLPVSCVAERTFSERMLEVQTLLYQGKLHASFNGIQVLRDLTSRKQENRAISMPVVFSNTLTPELAEWVPDWRGPDSKQVYASNQTPQIWLENQITLEQQGLGIHFNYVDSLFPPNLAEDMMDAYLELLHQALSDEAVSDQALSEQTIWQKTGAVVSIPESDRAERQAANDTFVDVSPRLLQDGLLDAAKNRPDAVAIEQGDNHLTYGELVDKSTQLAATLRESALIEAGDIIAVSLPQGPELIVGILGILQSGGAYVSIDPALPQQRRLQLLNRCQAKAVVTSTEVFTNPDEYQSFLRVDLDTLPDDTPLATVSPIQCADDLAYVIFTSGSTGEPKGVMISHNNAVNTLEDINRRFQVTADDAVLSIAPAGFDLSVYDYFGVLGAGGRLVFQAADAQNDPKIWCETLIHHGITIWNSVPAPVKVMVDRASDLLASSKLRLILMSGDWIPVDLPDAIRNALPDAQVISLGGATEGSIWSICYPIEHVEQDWVSIPYGKPLANQRFHVLNEWLEDCPKWGIGELYIAGEGVAQGYWADPEKTAQRFFTHPKTGERLYKTGDLGRYIQDGLIEILGREDNQVKINGYRVELGEVEFALLGLQAVNHVVIDAPAHPQSGQRQLVAYLVLHESADSYDHETLKQRCREQVQSTLPPYMVPTYFVILPYMPLTANGKIDRKALPAPWPEEHAQPAESTPVSVTESRLLNLWRDLLQHDDLDVNAGFFDVGGDSLIAVALLSTLREEFKVTAVQEQDLIEGLFMNTSIRQFAQIIESMKQLDGVSLG